MSEPTGVEAKRVVFEHGKYRVVVEEREFQDCGAFYWRTQYVVYPDEIECDSEHEALLKLLTIVCTTFDEQEAHWQQKLRALVVEKNQALGQLEQAEAKHKQDLLNLEMQRRQMVLDGVAKDKPYQL